MHDEELIEESQRYFSASVAATQMSQDEILRIKNNLWSIFFLSLNSKIKTKLSYVHTQPVLSSPPQNYPLVSSVQTFIVPRGKFDLQHLHIQIFSVRIVGEN